MGLRYSRKFPWFPVPEELVHETLFNIGVRRGRNESPKIILLRSLRATQTFLTPKLNSRPCPAAAVPGGWRELLQEMGCRSGWVEERITGVPCEACSEG